MKKYDLIYYWQNYLVNHDNIDFKANEYILKFSLINTYSRDIFCNWYSFSTNDELLGFLRYVLLPSIYITKAFGKAEQTIFLDALDQYETIELLEEASEVNVITLLKDLNHEYEILNTLSENFSEEKFKLYLNIINKRNEDESGIFGKIEFFENVNNIGKELIKEFEEDDMLEELESHMALKKNQILAMFDGIDKNPFMLKRLGTFLNNTLVF